MSQDLESDLASALGIAIPCAAAERDAAPVPSAAAEGADVARGKPPAPSIPKFVGEGDTPGHPRARSLPALAPVLWARIRPIAHVGGETLIEVLERAVGIGLDVLERELVDSGDLVEISESRRL